MAAVRVPVAKRALLLVLVESLEHIAAHRGRAERQVAARDAFGERHDVGTYVEAARAEHLAGATETGDHLVEDEQNIVTRRDFPQCAQVTIGRRDHSARAL